LSAGSMVMTPRIGPDFTHWQPPSGGDNALGVVDFAIFPHLDHPILPGLFRSQPWLHDFSEFCHAHIKQKPDVPLVQPRCRGSRTASRVEKRSAFRRIYIFRPHIFPIVVDLCCNCVKLVVMFGGGCLGCGKRRTSLSIMCEFHNLIPNGGALARRAQWVSPITPYVTIAHLFDMHQTRPAQYAALLPSRPTPSV
jgi:hypothetical protein